MILNENYIKQIILDEIAQAVSSNPTEYDVIASFNKINQAFFNNKLPRCRVNLSLKKNYLGYFRYDGYNGNKLINPIISINGMYQYNSNQLDSIVGHEMIHYQLALSGVDPKCTHDSAFKQMAAQMNSALGLNIDEKVDTGNMKYGKNQQNTLQPSPQLLAYMKSYMNSLNGYARQMKLELKNTNANVSIFISNLYTFTVSLIYALDRCVFKKTLNENGLQMPQFINDFIGGYNRWSHKALNFFDQIIRYREGYGGRGNYYGRNGKLEVNKNMKLAELLYSVFPDIENEYNRINNKSFNALNSMQYVTNTITVVNELKAKIDTEINNAQGSNP